MMNLKLLSVSAGLLFPALVFSQSMVLDADFGINGRSQVSFGPDDSILASLVMQPDGKILACGSYYRYDGTPGANPHNINQVAVARFNTDGSLDTTFGIGGKFLVPIGMDTENENNKIALSSSGKIVIKGNYSRNNFPLPNVYDYVLMRYNSNGTPDSSFGVNGILQVDFDNGLDIGGTMQLQADDKIVVGGSGLIPFPNSLSNDFAVSRYNDDGSKDLAFGTNGIVKINFGTASNTLISSEDSILDLKIQSDGKILAAGYTAINPERSKFALLRLNTNGTVDATFGTNGRVITDFSADDDIVNAIEILPDGSILAIGTRFFNDDDAEQVLVAKYLPNGTLDTSYGVGGKVTVDSGVAVPHEFAFGSQLLANGKLLITGSADTINSDTMLLRLNADGTPDTTFDNYGFLTFDAGSNGYSNAILLQTDGKVVVGGTTGFDTGTSEFTLWRLEEETLVTQTFAEANFSAAPNPFDGYIDLKSQLIENKTVSVDLIDISGRLVSRLTSNELFLQGQNSIRLNFPITLCKGTYFLKINDGKNSTTIKVLK